MDCIAMFCWLLLDSTLYLQTFQSILWMGNAAKFGATSES